MSTSSTHRIRKYLPLSKGPWPTLDPFLFCVHHLDLYPKGNPKMEPQASLSGRTLGSDFSYKDGWSMYHGSHIPGFPRHPHRGFETITVARQGYIDHSDSLGATARFGHGDVQWMTAGKGICHSEMFPLVNQDRDNPTELFQIWLNLPKVDKMTTPYFTMFWNPTIPHLQKVDSKGKKTQIKVIAGQLEQANPPKPPPNSWASRPQAHIGIWSVRQDSQATWVLPPTPNPDVNRVLYFFKGKKLRIDGEYVDQGHGVHLDGVGEAQVVNGEGEAEFLILQGMPIGEPVVQHGPFVMNTPNEIRQAIFDYRRTEFGGWPWKGDDPVHARLDQRFAIHADGRKDIPTP